MRVMAIAAFISFGWLGIGHADTGADPFAIEDLPRWVVNQDGFAFDVRVSELEFVVELVATYTWPNGESGSEVCEPDAEDLELYHCAVPPAPESGPGEMTYSVEALYGMHGTDRKASEPRTIPVSYYAELDITGVADERLLYPIPTEAYTVRYVPCCNIYGGWTFAERVPVNPEETDTGLPEDIRSDFLILEPDGLSKSTMGMYLDLDFGPEAFAELDADRVGLYEFLGTHWEEVATYAVDVATGTVTTHCPDGGVFVVGVKAE